MEERVFPTKCGAIHYWVGRAAGRKGPPLVFLPGLTADHRLFAPQTAWFAPRYDVLVWDAPGHGASWPFALDFDLLDKARWLDGILTAEGIDRPVLIGQSMGGYVAQAYLQLFPEKARGFIAVDSAPLQRRYVTAAELWMLKRMEPVYRRLPWRWLLRIGTSGVAVTPEGRALMRQMMLAYDGDQARYAALAGHGFRMLARAMEADLPYAIPCPALLLCGEKDRAGSCIRYSKAWHRQTGIPLVWVPDAGHNSNTDRPEEVNARIEAFLGALESSR